MARCETTHWVLDCGEGHGCYLVEFSDTGGLAGWGCASEPVTGRPKPHAGQPARLSADAELSFCCTDISRSSLAAALSDVAPFELRLADGQKDEPVSYCATGKLGDILASVGVGRR
jgi:hypothetical protein